MSMQTIECDDCGRSARLRKDGTIGTHHYQKHAQGVQCDAVGQAYKQHTAEFAVTQRGTDQKATEWAATCRCGRVWVAPTYDEVDELWATHSGAQPLSKIPDGTSR